MDYAVYNKPIKWVEKSELESYLMIDKLRFVLGDIAPKIIKIYVDPNYDIKWNKTNITYYLLKTERYSTSLRELIKKDKEKSLMVIERAKVLLKALHTLKILHTDLHESNIVYDEPTDRVSLIDFEGTADITTFLEKVSPDININNPLTKEDVKYMRIAKENFEWNHPDPNYTFKNDNYWFFGSEFQFTTKDTWLFDLEYKFFEQLEKRMNI